MTRVLLACALALVGCQKGQFWERIEPGLERHMDQPRVDPQEPTALGPLLPPKGTIPVSDVPFDEAVDTGRKGDEWVKEIPIAVDEHLLREGRVRFEIVCATCHGVLGDGDSPVARQMELRKPPSLHEERIRTMPDGMIFHVATHGFGLMPSFGPYLTVRERWAVVAYVRALELSRHAKVAELPKEVADELKEKAK